MNILPYTPAHREACLALFDSNRPKFFTEDERDKFINWLDHHTAENYYVMEHDGQIVACGGVYADGNEAGLSWGMVHADLHGKGFGKAFTKYRVQKMQELFPGSVYTINTSQHTVAFYEKMGFRVKKFTKDGYEPGLDRYDMQIEG